MGLDEASVFRGARELKDPQAVQAYLDATCADQPELRRRVERLLGLLGPAADFFDFNPAALEPNKFSDLLPTVVITEPASGTLPRLGDYQLLEEIARGGMGVVYKARQVSLDRLVAVKMLLPGALISRDFVQRFRVEASATASLRHPNIVAVHEVGLHGEQPYLVMDYIAGPTLAKLSQGEPMAPRRAAQYVKTIAEAVHFAHEQGVLHRDLKPSNVLIDANDQPQVTDFGLAKRLDGGGDLTLTGQVLGSPSYMSPEQASGKRGQTSRASDVYSLGAVLFHLLIGRPPFAAESVSDTIQMVLEREPIAPRALVMGVPRDLETICLMCLRKEPGKRYGTAQELADELGRFLRDEPIQARQATGIEKACRWCRRHPAVAGFGTATAALGLAIVIGSPLAIYRINNARQAEKRERLKAEQNLYVANMNVVQQTWDQNNIVRVRQLVDETATYARRGFEWFYWQRQLHLAVRTLRGHNGGINAVAFSPDGQRVVSGSWDHTAKVWDVNSGTEQLALEGHNERISSVAFSPDGQRIVTGSADQSDKVWEANSGKELLALKGHRHFVLSVAFSPDGQRIVTGSADQTAAVWDAANAKELVRLRGHSNWVHSAAFSPDGQRVVTGSADQTAKVWDATNGKELLSLREHSDSVRSAAFSPDAQRIVTGSADSSAKVWDVTTGVPLLTFTRHTKAVTSAAFSKDNQSIVTGSQDNTVKVWEAQTGKLLLSLPGHTDTIQSVAFSPDGLRIVSGSYDQTAKVWDATKASGPTVLKGTGGSVWSVAFSPDGRRIAKGSENGTATVWEASSGKELITLKGHSNYVWFVAFSPDGQRLITGGGDGTARVWDAAGKPLVVISTSDVRSVCGAFSSDGQRIAIASGNMTASVWEVASGKKLLTLRGHRGRVWSVAFSPDGHNIATASFDKTAKLWDAASGKETLSLRGHTAQLWSVAFSPDGRKVATGSFDRTAKIWDVGSGKQLISLEGHSAEIHSVCFSPDGDRIVTGSDDGTAKIWEAGSGRELLTLKGQSARIFSAVFSPDGQRLVTVGGDGTAEVWEAATAQEVGSWQSEEKAAREQLAIRQREQAAAAERDRAIRAQDPGAIKQWLVLAPLPLDDGSGMAAIRALDENQIPQEGDLRPRKGERVKSRDTERVWSTVQLEDSLLDFNLLLGEVMERSVAYAVCYIETESPRTGLLMKVGSDDQAKVYLNSKEIYRFAGVRACVADQDSIEGVELKAGVNPVVFKVANETDDWLGSLRFTDAAGHPLKGIRVTLDPDGKHSP